MVFNTDIVMDLKASAIEVLEAVVDNRNSSVIQSAFNKLNEMWNSSSLVLFRRIYGNAAISMPGDEQIVNWQNVVQGMNDAGIDVKFANYRNGTERLLQSMTSFYTGLSVMESAHLDDISKYYADK